MCKATNVFLRAQLCIVFKKNKVCELTSSVFYSSLCLFRRNNYTFGVVSLGRLWNILYEKEPLQLCFTVLRRKAAVFLYQNLIMRCYVTILTEIYDDPIFFGSGPGFVNPIRSDPVQVLLTPAEIDHVGVEQKKKSLAPRHVI